jgi:hypothetical protein
LPKNHLITEDTCLAEYDTLRHQDTEKCLGFLPQCLGASVCRDLKPSEVTFSN